MGLITAGGTGPTAPDVAGMRGKTASLAEVVAAAEAQEGASKGKGHSDAGWLGTALGRFGIWSSGQADPDSLRDLRRRAQLLAAYLEKEDIHVLATDDPEAAAAVGEMKREGYHLGLAVVWNGRGEPGDASGLNLSIRPAEEGSLARALASARTWERLPDNFAAEAGVPALDFEAAVERALTRRPAPAGTAGAHPRAAAAHPHEVAFLLSSGNGKTAKGSLNPFGHFGMAVRGEDGRYRVWTVQYNAERGSAFAGGLQETQLTLGEYLYGTHYLTAARPRASGQAIALGETSVGPVYAFILKNITEGQLERMREMAATISARHLTGRDRYDFTNKNLLTNCISLATQILRAAFFPVAESGTQVPADKAVEMIEGFARRLLDNQISPWDMELVTFERPEHAGSQYRIPNVPLGSPFFRFAKPWGKMTWWRRFRAVATPRILDFICIPRVLGAFAHMATARVTVGANSRVLEVHENADSPLRKLQEVGARLAALDAASVTLLEERRSLEASLLGKLGLKDWRHNPADTLEELAAEKTPGAVRLLAPERAALERDLERHHDLDVRLALNTLDQLREMHRNLFYRIIIADPLQRYAGQLAAVRTAYERIVALRDRIEAKRRLPSAAERKEIAALNDSVHTALREVRMSLLDRLGHSPPVDADLLLRGQVTRDMLEKLKDEALGAGGITAPPPRP